MIVAKFGGTAVTPRNLIYVKRILTEAHGAVVVSAVGKEFKEDRKATDLLLAYRARPDDGIWRQIADKYRRLAEVNAVDVDVDALLKDAQRRALLHDGQYCASLGEELSAKITAKFLGADYVEAEDVVRFDENGALLVEETYSNIRTAFDGGKLSVMGGFYGGTVCGRHTFSRGGGDVSGAIVAAALNASLYENWTDVSGVCIADPAKIHNVASVEGIGYSEMRLLSRSGAEVLHPDAIEPCERLGIPIKIGNFYCPDGASTLVSRCPSRCRLLSVAEKAADGVFVTTVLHSYPQWQMARLISHFLHSQTSELRFFNVGYTVEPDISAEFADHIVRLTSRVSILDPLYNSLTL